MRKVKARKRRVMVWTVSLSRPMWAPTDGRST
jgi:hypothetical protein